MESAEVPLHSAPVPWQNDYMVDFKMAWNHYFRAPPKKA